MSVVKKFEVGFVTTTESDCFGLYYTDSKEDAIKRCLKEAREAGINLFEGVKDVQQAKASLLATQVSY